MDWSSAGYSGLFPEPNLIIEITDIGGDANGVLPNDSVLQVAQDSLDGQSGVIYFPKGQYLFNSTVLLQDSIVLRGDGSDSSFLIFDLGNNPVHCINVLGSPPTSYVNITSGYQRGSREIEVSVPWNCLPGDYAEIRQENGAWDSNPASWAQKAVGQIVMIDSIDGARMFLNQELRFNFDTTLNLEIGKFNAKTNVGIECLNIERIDEPPSGAGYNIQFSNTAECWVVGVESNKSVGSHIMIIESTNIEVIGSYFHDAFTFDGTGTRGYGVTLSDRSGLCLIENNIFKRLRHAMMVKVGANGNVIAYNYSIEPNRSELISDFSGDISLHGHFSFANLFEGNIVQNIITDHFWGPSGPLNTIFRNRAELYGIIMTPGNLPTDSQNIVGNETTNSGTLMGNLTIAGNGNFSHGNNVLGTTEPPGTDILTESSYYRNSKPWFWNIDDSWPSIGLPNALDEESNPAKERWIAAGVVTDCTPKDTTETINTIIDSNPKIEKFNFEIFPNPFSENLIIRFPRSFSLTDVQIRLISPLGTTFEFGQHSISPLSEINLKTTDVTPGFYFLELTYFDTVKTTKLLKAK